MFDDDDVSGLVTYKWYTINLSFIQQFDSKNNKQDEKSLQQNVLDDIVFQNLQHKLIYV